MAWDTRYEMLKEGDIIRATDEVLTDSYLGWRITNPGCVGTPAPDPLYTSHRMYRRLKSPQHRQGE